MKEINDKKLPKSRKKNKPARQKRLKLQVYHASVPMAMCMKETIAIGDHNLTCTQHQLRQHDGVCFFACSHYAGIH